MRIGPGPGGLVSPSRRILRPRVSVSGGSGEESAPDFKEDFSDVSTLSALLAKDWVGFTDSETNMEFKTDGGINIDGFTSDNRLRYWFRPGDGPPTIYHDTTGTPVPGDLYEMWGRVYYSLDPDFTTDWGDPSANADYKWIFAVLAVSTRWEIHLDVASQGRRYTNSAPGGGDITTGPVTTTDYDGEIHAIEWHWKHESAVGASDGTVETLWGSETGGRNIYSGVVGTAETERENGRIAFPRWGANFNEYPFITSPGIWLDWYQMELWWEGNDPGWSWQGGP